MSLPDGFIDEIKARVRPSDIIGRSVALKRQGREFVGLSPFKKERTPSFFVNDEKGFYHCFASQKHGDVISWLQETQGLSFMEAVEALASEAGLDMPKPDPDSARQEERKKSLVEWMEAAQGFFRRKLSGSDAGEARSIDLVIDNFGGDAYVSEQTGQLSGDKRKFRLRVHDELLECYGFRH